MAPCIGIGRASKDRHHLVRGNVDDAVGRPVWWRKGAFVHTRWRRRRAVQRDKQLRVIRATLDAPWPLAEGDRGQHLVRAARNHRQIAGPLVGHVNAIRDRLCGCRLASAGDGLSPYGRPPPHAGSAASAHASRFVFVHGLVQNLFRVGRHLLRSAYHRLLRTQAFHMWDAVTCAC